MAYQVWFDMLTKGDAKRLCRWWNAHSKVAYEQFTVERSPSNRKFWAVIAH